MSYAVVTTKIDPQTKKAAMATAAEIGVPLSVVIKAFLKQFIRTKTVTFSVEDEVPNQYFIDSIKRSEQDIKEGNVSPAFKTSKDAVDWLEKQGI